MDIERIIKLDYDESLLRISKPIVRVRQRIDDEDKLGSVRILQLQVENVTNVPLQRVGMKLVYKDALDGFAGAEEDDMFQFTTEPNDVLRPGDSWVATTILDVPNNAESILITVNAESYLAMDRFLRFAREPIALYLAFGAIAAAAIISKLSK